MRAASPSGRPFPPPALAPTPPKQIGLRGSRAREDGPSGDGSREAGYGERTPATVEAPLPAASARLTRPIAVPTRLTPAAARGPPAQVATPAARPMASAVSSGYRPGLRASHHRA